MTHIGILQRIYRKHFEFLKMQNGGGRHLEKSRKSRYLRNGWTDLYEIGMLMQNRSLNRSGR